MTISAEYIDQIVQNVMREMKARVTVPAVVFAPVTAAQLAKAPGSGLPTVATNLTIAAKVISEDILVAARAAGRSITLQPGAIVTPSGRDYIRKNGVTVTGSVLNKPVTSTTGTFIVVGNSATCQSAASAAGWKVSAVSGEHDAAVAAAQTLKSGITVTCGGEPSVVACLLNRKPEVRAAVITKATNLLTLTTVMSPQVVCLDSSGWSFGDILKLLRSLSAANRPQGWKEI